MFFTKENGKVFPFEEEYRKRILAHFRVLAKNIITISQEILLLFIWIFLIYIAVFT